MKKKFTIFILAFFFGFIDLDFVSAQSIDSAEYFIDIDPGVGNGNAAGFIPADSIYDSLQISTTGLAPGFHYVFFRTQDTNRVWSLYEGALFYLADTVPQSLPPSYPLISVEYFYDTDPGIGNGIGLTIASADSIIDSLTISTVGLASGFHTIFYRVKDSTNVWSLYEGAKFYLTDTIPLALSHTYPIVSAEYFFDTDPGIGNGIALPTFATSDSITLTDTLPTAPLTAGTHYLFLRVKDSMNVWSLYEGTSFIICNKIPVPDFTADTVCLYTPTSFTDLSTNLDTSAQFTYAWDFNNDGITDDTTKGNTTHLFPSSGTHTVTLIVNNTSGCMDTVTKTVYVDSLPTVTFALPFDTLCRNDSIVLSGGVPAGGTYSGNGVWAGILYGDSVNLGDNTVYYTYYTTDSCFSTKSVLIYVDLCTGINEIAAAGYPMNVNPNPFRETTTLFIGNAKPNTNYELMFYNIVGEELQVDAKRSAEGFWVHRGNLVQGIYFYKVRSGNKIIGSGKLVVID